MNCRGDEDIDAKRSRPSIGKPVMGHARKERVVLFGTDQRITSGPAYEAVRPSPTHRYFRPRGWSRLCLSLGIAGQVLTFRTTAWSSFAPPTRRMPLGQSQDILRVRPGGWVSPRF